MAELKSANETAAMRMIDYNVAYLRGRGHAALILAAADIHRWPREDRKAAAEIFREAIKWPRPLAIAAEREKMARDMI